MMKRLSSMLTAGVLGLAYMLGCNSSRNNSGEKVLEQESSNPSAKVERIIPEGRRLFSDRVNKDGEYEIYKLDVPGAGSYALIKPVGEQAKQYFGGGDFVLAWFAEDYWKQKGVDINNLEGYRRWIVAGRNSWTEKLEGEMREIYRKGEVEEEGRVFENSNQYSK